MRLQTGTCATAFLLAFMAGVFLRPYLARLVHNMNGLDAKGPARPVLPAYWTAKAGQFRYLDRLAPTPNIVYLGDSTTDWIHLNELVRFDDGVVLNRSINGDTTSGVISRIRESFPSGVRLCFLLIGYNDLAQGSSPESIASRVAEILSLLTDTHTVDHVVLESLLPDAGRPHLPILAFNGRLRRLAAQEPRTSFLDLHPAFLRGDLPDASLFADHGHLNAAGMARRLSLERDHVRRFLPEFHARLRFLTPE